MHGHYLSPDINALYRRIIELGDEETNSTVIHDSVIARTSLTVEEAVNLEPQCIDTMDNFGLSPLQWAVLRNNIHGTGVLLSWNPNLELCDYDKRTALHRAAEFGLMECAQMLINSGAHVDASDAWGDTPLHLAISLESTDMINLLLSSGAKICENKYGRRPIHGSTFGSFPHDEAIIARHVESLQTAGADINGLDFDGMTPLLVSVQQSHIPMLTTLQRMGAVLETKTSHTRGRTVFHIAAMFSDSAMVRKLHEVQLSQIDPDEVDNDGLTAMELISMRLTLSAAELSEGQQPISAEELSFFKRFIEDSRNRYRTRRIFNSEVISDFHDDDSEESFQSSSDTGEYLDAVEEWNEITDEGSQ